MGTARFEELLSSSMLYDKKTAGYSHVHR